MYGLGFQKAPNPKFFKDFLSANSAKNSIQPKWNALYADVISIQKKYL